MKHRWIGSFWRHVTEDREVARTVSKDAEVVAELARMADFDRRDNERRQAERIDADGKTGRRVVDVAEGIDESQAFIQAATPFLWAVRGGLDERPLVYTSPTPEDEENDEPGCNTCDGWVVVGSKCPDCGLKGWAKE